MGSPVPFRPTPRASESAAAVAETLIKTLAVLLVPSAAMATLVGESVAAVADMVTADDRPERKLRQEIESIADGIARTSTVLLHLAGPDEDLNAAVFAVRDTLEAVPLSTGLIINSGFSADHLYAYYLEQDRGRVAKAGLGSTDWAYHRMLREVSARMIGVLQTYDPAQGMVISDLTEKVRHVTEQLDYPVALRRSLDQVDDAFHFLNYRDRAGHRLAQRKLGRRTGRISFPLQATFVETRTVVNGSIQPLTATLAASRRVLLTGGPGSGKTMLLRHLFHRILAHERLDGTPNWDSIVPLYIDLQDQAALPALGDVPKQLNDSLVAIPGRWAQERAESGSAAILLDGVESLLCNPRRGPQNLDAIEEWLTTTATNSAFVIAARRGTIAEDWLSEHGFTIAELQPLHLDDVCRLITRWHGAVADQSVTADDHKAVVERADQLITGIGKVSDLAEMMRNPLIATLVCEEFLESGLALPHDWIDLVDKVLARLAARDAGNTPAPGGQNTKLASDIHQEIAEWCLHNSTSLNQGHLSDSMSAFTKAQPPSDAAPLMDQVFAHYSILNHTHTGMAFVSDAIRDHLAAQALVDKVYLGFLEDEARTARHARVAIAGAGRLKQNLATELVAKLLDEADLGGDNAASLAAVALCAAHASRTIDPAVLARAADTAGRLIPPPDEHYAHLCEFGCHVLDVLARTEAASNEHAEALVRCAIALARHVGEPALLALAIFAAHPGPGSHGLLWDAWPFFDREPYARLVLSQLHAPTGALVVNHPDELAALRYLPGVTIIEFGQELPAVSLNSRTDLTVRVARREMILQAELLDQHITIEVVGENEGRDGGC
jgi:hypothetical protein